MSTFPTLLRDVSWLHFNERVLQEAKDPNVPLYEKIKFLAIYSSNLDEFFRVRVSSLRSFKELNKETRKSLNIQPKKSLKAVKALVQEQQEQFGAIYRDIILKELEEEQIFLLATEQYNEEQSNFADQFFKSEVKNHIRPIEVSSASPHFLKNKGLYFAVLVKSNDNESLQIIELPVADFSRFQILPSRNGDFCVTFLDDIIRHGIKEILPDYQVIEIGSIKVSRDAELYIDDEFSGDLIQKLKESLENRTTGLPTRFLYDASISPDFLSRLKTVFGLSKYDLIPGARYHNFNDFFQFPRPDGQPHLFDEDLPELNHAELDATENILNALENGDEFLLSYPYQSIDYLLRLLDEAAEDELVESIKITLYRVAEESDIANRLIKAVKNGKSVTVFVELKARFNEESNLSYGDKLEDAGATVLYSYPGIKVHAKILLITRKKWSKKALFAYLSTGNFNEKTAGLYGDHAIMTGDSRLTNEVEQVFGVLGRRLIIPKAKHLLISPFTTRIRFSDLVEHEIELAKTGKLGYIILKMNSLEDPQMIQLLYRASMAGVKIQLIIRGICCLQAGVDPYSLNISARSIVDHYLEHARVYIFGNNGKEVMFMSSADWMQRNLDRRIEVSIPVYNEKIKRTIRKIIDIQLSDNTKARNLSPTSLNQYFSSDEKKIRSQKEIYLYLMGLNQVEAPG